MSTHVLFAIGRARNLARRPGKVDILGERLVRRNTQQMSTGDMGGSLRLLPVLGAHLDR